MSQCNHSRPEYTLLRKALWCLNDHSVSSDCVNTLPTVLHSATPAQYSYMSAAATICGKQHQFQGVWKVAANVQTHLVWRLTARTSMVTERRSVVCECVCVSGCLPAVCGRGHLSVSLYTSWMSRSGWSAARWAHLTDSDIHHSVVMQTWVLGSALLKTRYSTPTNEFHRQEV